MGMGHLGLLYSSWSMNVSLIKGYMYRNLRKGKEGTMAAFQTGAGLSGRNMPGCKEASVAEAQYMNDGEVGDQGRDLLVDGTMGDPEGLVRILAFVLRDPGSH